MTAHPLLERSGLTLEKVGPENLAECGIGCVLNPKHEGFQPKTDWLRRRFDEGLRFLLWRDAEGKPLGFLEYAPGEEAWRPVHAQGWLFVHCLWVYPRGKGFKGLGTDLIKACLREADKTGAEGVAAMVSDGPWMVGPELFRKTGFETVDQADRFELVANRLRGESTPRFRDIAENRTRYEGLHVVYSPQCPMLPKSVNDLAQVAVEHGLELNVTVLENPSDAQRAPSYYGVFSLLWNGTLLADHYVSKARFRNILRDLFPDGDVSR